MSTVFLDRDGVINANRSDYVKSWDEFHFLPGARRAIAHLTRAGHRVFIVTNQACIGKGLVSPAAIEEIHVRMLREIARFGGRVEAVLCCPHRADTGCECRKPAPGLLLRAMRDYGADLSRAVLVGDSLTDMHTAASLNIPSILTRSGLGRLAIRQAGGERTLPYPIASDLSHAVRLILSGEMVRVQRNPPARVVISEKLPSVLSHT